jgi:hypothetical protein
MYLLPEDVEVEDNNFYLWDIHLPAWEIFILLRNYLDENGVIPTDLLIEIVRERNKEAKMKKEEKLRLLDILEEIPLIHSSYLNEKHNLTKDKK